MNYSQQRPILSVRLMTYNHEKFIAQAIEGCLAQEANFTFEIVIGDDFSQDRTLEICKGYQSKYPNIVRVLDRKKHDDYWNKRQKLGRLWNFADILNNCKGEYTALLDGDDYWIDTNKIQKQVDLLVANPSYAFSFHNCLVKNKDRMVKKDMSFIKGSSIGQIDVLTLTNNNFVPSSSIVLRNNDLPSPLPDWFYEQPMGDWALILLLLSGNKRAHYLQDELSIYRQDGQGLWENYGDIILTLKKRDFIQNMKHLPLNIEKNVLNEIIFKFDKEIEHYVRELSKRDYYNLNISQTLNHLFYRGSYAFKRFFSFKK